MISIHVFDSRGTETILKPTMGISLMENIRNAGVEEVLAICGGCCACGTCHIVVDPSDYDRLPPPSESESSLLEGLANPTLTSRLSCQIMVNESLDGLSVTVAVED